MTGSLSKDNAFWRFSLRVYTAPGVAQECLSLQQELEIDINALLFCAWLGTQGISIDERDIEFINGIVGSWHGNVVRRLRAVRMSIKTMSEMEHGDIQALRKKVATIELEAEQVEQALLYRQAAGRWGVRESNPRFDAIRANLRVFLWSEKRVSSVERDRLSLDSLVEAAVGTVQ